MKNKDLNNLQISNQITNVTLVEKECNMKANDENLKEQLKRREFIEAHEENDS